MATMTSPQRALSKNSPPLPRRWSVSPSDLNWIVLGVGIVLFGMWFRHGGASNLADPIGIMTSIGQLTAIFGTYLALVGVLLMSRAPWIDQVVGSDEASRLHRLAGFASVWLLLAHAIASSAAFASFDSIASPGEIWASAVDFTFNQPGGLGGSVALALFIVVAIVSVRAARSRISYETWYGIHLYVYIAVALGFLHQIKIGSDFATDQIALITWIAIYAVTFLPLVIYRFIEPLIRNIVHRYYIDQVVLERPGVTSIYIAGSGLHRLPVRAGQWFGIRVLTADGWWRSHPFSLSAGPDGKTLRFTIEALGDRTHELQRVKPGTRVYLEGPYGILTGAVRTREKVLLIAGGIGITPLRALLEVLPARRGDLALLYRGPSKESLVLRTEVDRIAEMRGAKVSYMLGSRDKYAFRDDPLSPAGLWASYPDIRDRDVYLCGSPSMMSAVEESLKELGVPKRQVHLERFNW
ncbi:MAG: ferredoxin reductase family protein [Chloroflexota bacterium]